MATSAAIPVGSIVWKQWQAPGGNGNWYGFFNGRYSWTDARQIAFSHKGDLATSTSAGENAFVTALIESQGDFRSTWLGGYQVPGALEPAGDWRWVTGEPFTFTAWSPGEPNNSGDENFLQYKYSGWNDARLDERTWNDSFVIETAVAPLPPPPTFTLIRGTPGDDTLVGDNRRNRIEAYEGDDLIEARGGDDIVFAGDGADTVYGGEGTDRIYGQEGDDVIDTGPGNDSVYGGAGDDVIYGSDQKNLLAGQDGNDTIYGGGGNDRIYGGAGDNRLYGGAGKDDILGGSGDDMIWGDDGDDVIDGKSGADIIYGGAGNDRIHGGSSVIGGSDVIHGGDGDDIISGGGDDDFLFGDAGNDRIFGQIGSDRLQGGAGNDTLDGGHLRGADTAVYAGARADYTIWKAAADDAMFFVRDDNPADGDEGHDRLIRIEFLEFADQTVDVSDYFML